jgi:nucleoid DNA-binding protein
MTKLIIGKAQLVRIIMGSGVVKSSRDAKTILNYLSNAIIENLKFGYDVRIKGLGTLKPKKWAGRGGVNINTGEEIKLVERNSVGLTLTKSFKRCINNE